MDALQKKLQNSSTILVSCLDDRKKVKGILLDVLPTEKLQVNLLLNAYDEDIVRKLSASKDRTLTALNMAKGLKEDYGVTDSSAMWAIQTWCYILRFTEIADALGGISTANQTTVSRPQVTGSHMIGMGVYKAGFDFQPGDILLKHITKDLQAPGFKEGVTILMKDPIEVYINDTSNFKGAKKICSFMDSCHLEIDVNKYLILKCDAYHANMIKIELIEYNT